MKFKPVGTDTGGTAFWISDNGRCEILANEHRVTICMRTPDSVHMNIMPLEINLVDRGITAFVVRGILDALVPIQDDPYFAEVQTTVRAYLDRLCPEEGRVYSPVMLSSGLTGVELLKSLGERRAYFVRRDYVRRYLKDHEVQASRH